MLNLAIVLQWLTLVAAGLFTGAALYINLVEHPARASLREGADLAQFRPSYRRAGRLQAPLALISLVAGTGAWALGGHWFWLSGALLIGAAVPYTFAAIMPVNHRLLAETPPAAGTVRELLGLWNRHHWVRTCLGLTGFALISAAGVMP